ncbi:MAG TPA: DUF4340 domain-containing protein [Candidatus Binatia bacterium]|nr:DUF4340 domain-containing protein [Candidatus Binatia bacterium]
MGSWKTTFWLLGAGGLLFGTIVFLERHAPSTAPTAEVPPRLVALRASDVTNIVVRRTNQFVLRADRTNLNWNITLPFSYPGQSFAMDKLLSILEDLAPHTHLTQEELQAQKRSLVEFGLDVPAATLVLNHKSGRSELQFGSRTAISDQVYVQVMNIPGVYVVPADLLQLLPQTANDWRDTALVNLTESNLDRFEIRTPARSFAIEVDPTNKVLYLSKPTRARASSPKVEALVRKLQSAQALQFVTDDPRADLDVFGLRPPEAELVLGLGTNDLQVVQFGKSPTNDPTVVYARRMAQTNIVLVPRSILEALQTSHAELRDRHVLAFPAGGVESIEVRGEQNFTIRKQTNNLWFVTEPEFIPADSELVRGSLTLLGFLEGQVEKDVVTDFAPYGLATPARQYILRASATNSLGAPTNRIVAQLDVGARRDNIVFARGAEETVYSLPAAFLDRLPAAAWQLRERRVWSFSTNQVIRLTIQHRGYQRQVLRSPLGEWSLAPGSQGIINTFAVEELMYRLGELRAVSWVARGDEGRAQYGFTENSHKLLIELRLADKPRILTLEFSSRPAAPYPYALAAVDGQTWIFEFPPDLFSQISNYLANPAVTADSAAR